VNGYHELTDMVVVIGTVSIERSNLTRNMRKIRQRGTAPELIVRGLLETYVQGKAADAWEKLFAQFGLDVQK
jgi:hypothetical protein